MWQRLTQTFLTALASAHCHPACAPPVLLKWPFQGHQCPPSRHVQWPGVGGSGGGEKCSYLASSYLVSLAHLAQLPTASWEHFLLRWSCAHTLPQWLLLFQHRQKAGSWGVMRSLLSLLLSIHLSPDNLIHPQGFRLMTSKLLFFALAFLLNSNSSHQLTSTQVSKRQLRLHIPETELDFIINLLLLRLQHFRERHRHAHSCSGRVLRWHPSVLSPPPVHQQGLLVLPPWLSLHPALLTTATATARTQATWHILPALQEPLCPPNAIRVIFIKLKLDRISFLFKNLPTAFPQQGE